MICELCFHHCDLSEGQTGFCQGLPGWGYRPSELRKGDRSGPGPHREKAATAVPPRQYDLILLHFHLSAPLLYRDFRCQYRIAQDKTVVKRKKEYIMKEMKQYFTSDEFQ